jgi:hypothetical protein
MSEKGIQNGREKGWLKTKEQEKVEFKSQAKGIIQVLFALASNNLYALIVR